MDEKIIWLLVLTILILVKGAVVPLIKWLRNKGNNPINLDRLYQEFKDFKETQKEWNEKTEGRIDNLEKRRK